MRYTGTKTASRLVVVSQTCDIARSAEDEPSVMAFAVERVNEEQIARIGKSVRRFVLDRSRGLVADARVIALIDKEMLLQIKPEQGPPDRKSEREFSRWLARRFLRPTHPDLFVERVRRPIQNAVSQRITAKDPSAIALGECSLRIFPPPDIEKLPYLLELIVVMPEETESSRAARIALISPFIQDLVSFVDGGVISDFQWTLVGEEELRAQDLLDSDEFLED